MIWAIPNNILRVSQPDLTFDPISEGEITVGSEAGIFGGVKTLDADLNKC